MATFNTHTALAAWKKIQYKDGIVKADFVDGDGKLITVKGGEMPHPDFRTTFGKLAYFVQQMLITHPTMIEPICLAYPDLGKLQITAKVRTIYSTFEVKTEAIDYDTVSEWADVEITDPETGEVRNLLQVARDIDEQTRLYLFENKTAQAEIQFPEMKHDGMDGARALLKIADSINND